MTRAGLPPTPAKFHYIFNLRDLSRVTEGVCLAAPEVFERSEQLVRLFRNEVQRIFCDRLVSDGDLATVEGKLAEIISSQWPEARDDALQNPIIFGDFEKAVARLTEVSISAFRGVAGPSRHRRASSPGEEGVGGLFVEFEAIRTGSSDHDAPRMTWSP